MYRYIFIALIISCSVPKNNTRLEYNEQFRPQVHFSPKVKWTNDPNGLVYHEGVYHLFFQYYPDSIVWGPMHWGHATSPDMIQWKEQPIALYPNSIGYIFSGSAVVDKANTSGFGSASNSPLVAIFSQHDAKNEKSGTHQTQGIAYSLDNGKNFTVYDKNPVLGNPGMWNFRDPKVMWHEETGKWIMTLATGNRVMFYSSDDLKSWKKNGEFGEKAGAHGGVWECPDLLPIVANGEKLWLLISSIYPGGLQGGSGTQYFIGKFNGSEFVPVDTTLRWLDYGPDNYATITWSNVKDRAISLGWMSNWKYAAKVPTSEWRGAMTLPRELGIVSVDGEYHLTSRFVDEIKNLYSDSAGIDLSGEQEIRISDRLKKFPGTIRLDLTTEQAKDFSIEFTNGKEKLIVGFDAGKNEYYLDRSMAGNHSFHEDFNKIKPAPRIAKTANVDLSIVLDFSSVEVIADNGLTPITALFYPQEPFNDAIFRSSSKLNGRLSVKTLPACRVLDRPGAGRERLRPRQQTVHLLTGGVHPHR